MQTLHRLKTAGNTVIVVEHDEETILQADYIIDVGPGGGKAGGEIVACGLLGDIIDNPRSVTGHALQARLGQNQKTTGGTRSSSAAESKILMFAKKNSSNPYLKLSGVTTNNLRNLNVSFPLGELTVVCGVSGAGKSSLIHETLVPALVQNLSGRKNSRAEKNRTWKELKSHESIERVLEIDQTPIGKTSSSTPASFLGIFDRIRKIYAMLPEAKSRGWSAGHFSFNSGKGRCPTCHGRGFIKIPMSFLPDAITVCEECSGLRYQESTLDITYQGLAIGQLLQKTMSEAKEILAVHRQIRRTLDYVHELGLGYLTLGQPTYTLSGGEAQRLKIARELGSRNAENTFYILDEPTIGLHMVDVDKLLRVLRQLIALGNTVVVIEHNLDVIRMADNIIELGPGPGEAGGQLLFSGSPEELAKSKKTPTGKYLSEREQSFSLRKGSRDTDQLCA